MRNRIISIVTALALTVALLPATVTMASAATTYTASNSAEFHNALTKAHDGDIIQVAGSFVVKNSVSNNDSLVIDKAVTIEGGSLTFWYAGILLAADVTFKDTTLGLASNVRNAIMANGHTLTLENVQRDPTTRYIHLFCGGQTGKTQGELSAAKQGSHGQIILRGNTNLGLSNIYAGSISTDNTDNVFTKPATVTIEPSVKGQPIEHIYASGALETYTSENDWFDFEHEIDPPAPSTERFPVSGDVTFNLYGSMVKELDGGTGTAGKYAAVTYNGTSYLNDGLVLKNIGGLDMQSGNLIPAGGSSFAMDSVPLSIASGASLGLNNLGSVVYVDAFTGGGALSLAADQKLVVTGDVSGSTTVGIGSIFNGHSQTFPTLENHTYIVAAGSKADSFTLAAPASRPDIALVKSDAGAWTATSGNKSTKTIVEDFALTSVVADPSDMETAPGTDPILWFASLPFESVTYAFNSAQDPIAFIPLQIKVNGNEAKRTDGENAYSYALGNLTLAIAGDSGKEDLQIETTDGSALTGSYRIEITVPAENSGSGQPITRAAILTVKAESGDTKIPVPEARTGLIYTGEEQTGVSEGGGYTLTGDSSGIGAGAYTAIATLTSGFMWSDGSTDAKDILWQIAKAAGPATPTGLTASAPSAYGKSDGKITGTTAKMEYSKTTAFTNAVSCTEGETAVEAGSYYVRVKASDNYEAGAAVPVTVPEAPLTVQSIAISSTKHKTRYQVGDALDVENLILTVTMSDNSSYPVAVAAGMVSGFDSTTASTSQTLTVSYGKETATYVISIAERSSSGGGGGGGGGSAAGGSSATNSTTNPDGSVTTTTTDRETGAVTITNTAKNGVKVETVIQPDADTTARVTIPAAVKTATVTIPDTVTAGTVAVDAKTGEIVTLSVPTEDGMVVKLDGSADLILEDRSKAFTDIDGHWAEDAIDFATAHGLFNGTSETTFTPNAPMTRGMIVAALYRLEGEPTVEGLSAFDDVTECSWYSAAVRWAAKNTIVSGYGDGRFGAGDSITREQLVTFLYRYAGAMGAPTDGSADLSAFRDGDRVSAYAVEAMGWAVDSGLISGFDGDILAPQDTASRAQVAAILNRFVANLTM